jgi:hypothetical protein
MCWWIFGHCWHRIENSEMLLPVARRQKCHRQANPFISIDKYGAFFTVKITEECCLCGRRKYCIVYDYNILDSKYKIDNSKGIYWG